MKIAVGSIALAGMFLVILCFGANAQTRPHAPNSVAQKWIDGWNSQDPAL